MSLGEIDDREFRAFTSRIKKTVNEDKLKKAISEGASRVGKQALKQFKANTPVDTGNLRKSWEVSGPYFTSGSWIVKLENNADYASHVEYGHRQKVGQFVPAIGKRLKASWVPGQFFMEKSKNQIELQLPVLLAPSLFKFRNLLS